MILINEWLPNPKGTDAEGEWIELRNSGAEAANLKGWALQAGSGKKYILKEATIAPGGYALVPRSESRLSLKNEGGAIALYDPAGALRDEASFAGSAPEGMSWSRSGERFSFAAPTPGAANIAPPPPQTLASVSGDLPPPPHASLLSVSALGAAVALAITCTVVLAVKKDETLSKLFFG